MYEMQARIVRIKGAEISNWDQFHTIFSAALGFPEFYGRNLNAWIDCLSYRREDDGMSSVNIGLDELIVFEITESNLFRRNFNEGFIAFEECIVAVNQRYLEQGQEPALGLILV